MTKLFDTVLFTEIGQRWKLITVCGDKFAINFIIQCQFLYNYFLNHVYWFYFWFLTRLKELINVDVMQFLNNIWSLYFMQTYFYFQGIRKLNLCLLSFKGNIFYQNYFLDIFPRISFCIQPAVLKLLEVFSCYSNVRHQLF